MSRLAVRPLTAELWPDFVRLFGEAGVGGGCWCMYWRCASRRDFDAGKGESNKQAMQALVESGKAPGLLAFVGDVPAGWCAVAPRTEYAALNRSPSRRAIDDEPVWSITCLYVARPYRRQRMSIELIHAAVNYVRRQQGRVVEAYPTPVKPGVSSTAYAFTGFVAAYEAAGFVEVRRRRRTRPILRRVIGRRWRRR